MIPQLIVIALGMIGLGMNIAKHKEKKKERRYNGWSQLIAIVVFWSILYYGGFWNCLLQD